MHVYLSHETALQIWRSPAPPSLRMDRRHEIPIDFTPQMISAEAEELRNACNLIGPITTCVMGNGNNRRRNAQLHSRIHPGALPNREYLKIEPGLFIASPELTLAQVASRLIAMDFSSSRWQSPHSPQVAAQIVLTYLMCELCSEYALDPESADGFVPRSPITTVERLRRFGKKTGRYKGKSAFDAAVDATIPNSYSPAETTLALLETTGLRLGGMGLAKKPHLNMELESQTAYGRNWRRGDQVFEDDKTIVEYNGGYHQGQRANKDNERRLELENAGYQMTVINKEELLSAKRLDWAMKKVAAAVGRTGRRTSDYEQRQADLRALVFEMSNTKCWENHHNLIPVEYMTIGSICER